MSTLSLILRHSFPLLNTPMSSSGTPVSFLVRKTPLDLRSAPLWLLYSVTELLLIVLRLARALHQEQKPNWKWRQVCSFKNIQQVGKRPWSSVEGLKLTSALCHISLSLCLSLFGGGRVSYHAQHLPIQLQKQHSPTAIAREKHEVEKSE